jgi:hypothetical protein
LHVQNSKRLPAVVILSVARNVLEFCTQDKIAC